MSAAAVSPLAPAAFAAMAAVKGVRLATAAAQIRYAGRDDLLLVELAPGTTAAGVFTRSLCTAAPVDWCRDALAASGGASRAVIVNSGNANAFTGASGDAAARRTAELVAAALDAAPAEVLVSSTGVIGEDLPTERIEAALDGLLADLREPDTAAWEAAAEAIGTTDTFPKGACAPVKGTDAHVVGIAKGSGMIAPDMATMLAFVFTDLRRRALQLLQTCLSRVGANAASTASPSTPTRPPATPCCSSPPANRSTTTSPTPTIPQLEAFHRSPRRRDCSTSPTRSCATARAPPSSSSRHRHRRRRRSRPRKAIARRHRQTRRW